MSDAGGPYLFDVGVTALAHAGTPVSGPALDCVRRAIAGEIDAVVPHASIVGAHHVLVTVYGFSNDEGSRVLTRFMDANRVQWYDGMRDETVRGGLDLAAGANIDGWDGYYAQVAREEGVGTILTLDDDFERIDGVATEVVLSSAEFARLNEYLGH